MDKHINLLGILFIVLGIIRVIGLSIAAYIMHGFRVFSIPNHYYVVLQNLIMYIFVFEGIISVIGIIGGIGLLKKQNWAKWLVLILGFILLLQIPLGTILGIYTIWVLMIRDGLTQEVKTV